MLSKSLYLIPCLIYFMKNKLFAECQSAFIPGDSCVQKQLPEVFCKKKVSLENLQNSYENTCARVSFLIKACNFIKKETLAQMFSCEYCEISRTPSLQNTSGRLLLCVAQRLSVTREIYKSFDFNPPFDVKESF